MFSIFGIRKRREKRRKCKDACRGIYGQYPEDIRYEPCKNYCDNKKPPTAAVPGGTHYDYLWLEAGFDPQSNPPPGRIRFAPESVFFPNHKKWYDENILLEDTNTPPENGTENGTDNDPLDGGYEEDEDSANNYLTIIGVILLIAALAYYFLKKK